MRLLEMTELSNFDQFLSGSASGSGPLDSRFMPSRIFLYSLRVLSSDLTEFSIRLNDMDS